MSRFSEPRRRSLPVLFGCTFEIPSGGVSRPPGFPQGSSARGAMQRDVLDDLPSHTSRSRTLIARWPSRVATYSCDDGFSLVGESCRVS